MDDRDYAPCGHSIGCPCGAPLDPPPSDEDELPFVDVLIHNAAAASGAFDDDGWPGLTIHPPGARCESGWTGDRCTFALFHDGPHSNELGIETARCSNCGDRVLAGTLDASGRCEDCPGSPRICPACGFNPAAPGDRYCVDCGSAADRSAWAG